MFIIIRYRFSTLKSVWLVFPNLPRTDLRRHLYVLTKHFLLWYERWTFHMYWSPIEKLCTDWLGNLQAQLLDKKLRESVEVQYHYPDVWRWWILYIMIMKSFEFRCPCYITKSNNLAINFWPIWSFRKNKHTCTYLKRWFKFSAFHASPVGLFHYTLLNFYYYI